MSDDSTLDQGVAFSVLAVKLGTTAEALGKVTRSCEMLQERYNSLLRETQKSKVASEVVSPARTRVEVAAFINSGDREHSEREKGTKTHYGVQELRSLMDYIYSGAPKSTAEELKPGWLIQTGKS